MNAIVNSLNKNIYRFSTNFVYTSRHSPQIKVYKDKKLHITKFAQFSLVNVGDRLFTYVVRTNYVGIPLQYNCVTKCIFRYLYKVF